MRILRKECRKILDPKLLLIIAVFTFLYYQMFLHITSYQSVTAILPVALQLLDEAGATLTVDELELLCEKRETVIAKLNPVLAANDVLSAAKVENYDQMLACYAELSARDDRTDTENMVYWEIFHITASSNTDRGEAAAYCSQIKYLDRKIEELQNCFWFNVPAAKAEQLMETVDLSATSLFRRAETRFCQREMSLLPFGIMSDLWGDMRYIAVLLVLNCLILLVPWQVQERRREVLALYASTHTGRGIFGKQFLSGLLSCGAVCALQLLLYLACFASKGFLAFWRCPAWTDGVNMLWLPVSFGLYIAVFLFMVWLFTLGCAAAAYCIGRCAASYVSGIALSIPIGGLLCVSGRYLFNAPFFFSLGVRVPLWEVFALTVWLILAGGVLFLFLRRDQKRGL